MTPVHQSQPYKSDIFAAIISNARQSLLHSGNLQLTPALELCTINTH